MIMTNYQKTGDDNDQSSFKPDVTFDAGGFLFEPQLTSIVIAIIDSDGHDDSDDDYHDNHNLHDHDDNKDDNHHQGWR